MKQLIIFLLLIILGIMGYNLYKKWQRFNPPNYEYSPTSPVHLEHSNKELVLDYHRAVNELNGFVITQWSAHGIDVRNPQDDDAETMSAVNGYAEKLAAVHFYEGQLSIPQKATVKEIQPKSTPKMTLIRKVFKDNPSPLRLGERSAMVFEIQQLLIEKGDSITKDGHFSTETFNALKSFEEKNGLFPDGKLDAITLDYLLR